MQQFLANFLAGLIERAVGNYRLTIMGACAALACGLAVYCNAVHPAYATVVISIAGFLSLLAGALGYDKPAAVPPAQSGPQDLGTFITNEVKAQATQGK